MRHHSSRRCRLDQSVLNSRLTGAVAYDRIAGYFRSSLFEIAGEALNGVRGAVRIVCNSELDPEDISTAAAAQAAMRRSWCSGRPEDAPAEALPRYKALCTALTSGKLDVRVLPDSAFGLIHGKAGVIRYAEKPATAFLGSVNESATAWKMNYELLWEDDSAETVAWVQEEFEALWNDPRAIVLHEMRRSSSHRIRAELGDKASAQAVFLVDQDGNLISAVPGREDGESVRFDGRSRFDRLQPLVP
jgi:hypothetical protein